MNKLYIQDSTIRQYVTFNTVPELVAYLNDLIPRAFKISRSEYVQNLIDLGHGYDDPQGIMVTRVLSEQFNIGFVKNGNYIKADVHELSNFQNEEFGSNTINRFEDRGKF
jgi:hypothetical protein